MWTCISCSLFEKVGQYLYLLFRFIIQKLSSSFNSQLLNDIETEDIEDLGIDENGEEEGEDQGWHF